MRGLVLSQGKVHFREDLRRPAPAANEVLVRVLLAGICETDFQLVRGYMGYEGILGHEFVGIAESGRYTGQRVVGEINCACRNCPDCERGLGNHCPHRSVVGILGHAGIFADYVAIPEVNLHPVPETVSTRQAVFTEPLAAAFQVPAQIPLSPGLPAVVLGDGRLGNLCAQVLRGAGCQVLVVGKHPDKLKRLSQLGLSVCLLSGLPTTRTAELVVDCTGSPTGLATALRLVRPRGTIFLKTTVAAEHQLSLAPIVIDEITVVGSRCGPFVPALAALAAQEIHVDSLIDAEFPLADGVTALEQAQSRPWLKTLLHIADT